MGPLSSAYTAQGRGFGKVRGSSGWDKCQGGSRDAVPAAWVVPRAFSESQGCHGALFMVAPSLLGVRTVDCRCMEPVFPFGALLPASPPFSLFPSSTLLREHLTNSLLEEAGAALRGDIAAMTLGCYSHWSTCQAFLWWCLSHPQDCSPVGSCSAPATSSVLTPTQLFPLATELFMLG